MKNSSLAKLPVFFLILSLISCGKNATNGVPSSLTDTNHNSSTDLPNTKNPDDTGSDLINAKPTICSDLSFSHVLWPSALTEFQVNVFALAMNISGSFEGPTGWTNLTNNFDGQGISLGLFNQNLGQGSLQPMMIKLRDTQLTKMKSFYSKTQYTSVSGMLAKWGGVANGALTKATPMNSYESDFSDLDDPEAISAAEGTPSEFLSKVSSSKNQASVDWAVKTVFNGSSFKSEWATALQKMAGSPEFVTIQVAAARAIHVKTLGYMNKFHFKEIHAYLFFFDVIVQNGGISTSIATKYLAWAKQNPNASETTRLKKILEYRLTLVIAKYRNDVKTRKTAVIDGSGVVHGEKRNFAKEYCAPSWTLVIPASSLM